MIMKVGITATRKGMSENQKTKFASDLRHLIDGGFQIEFHHGDCVGGDAEGDLIARNLGATIHIHPPVNPKYRAFCAQPGDVVYPEKPYLDRDRDIVNSVEIMYGGPKNHLVEEFRGSGTWTTIRYARSQMDIGEGPVALFVLKR